MQIKQIENKTNGLRSLLINLPDSYGVAVAVFVKSGSRHDPKGKEGLAHFIEHMFFKGSKRYPNTISLATAIENLGGDTNASTSFDTTHYYIKAPYDQVKGALNVLSEIMQNPLFDNGEMEKERMVIKEEIKMYEDDPQSDLFDNIFLPTLFKDTTLKVNPAGFLHSVESIKNDDLFSFVKNNYTANNMVVVITGRIDFNEIEELVNTEFSWIKSGIKTEIKDNFIMPQDNRAEKNKNLQQSHILIGGFGVKHLDPNKYALQLGNALLGSGFTSKLFTHLREKNGLSYYQGSIVSSLLDVGFYSIYAGVNRDKIELALELIEKSVSEIKKGEFSEEDLNRVKLMVESSFKKDLEGIDDYASFFGQEYIKTGKIQSIEELLRTYGGVTKEKIIEVMNQIYTNSNRLVCIVK